MSVSIFQVAPNTRINFELLTPGDAGTRYTVVFLGYFSADIAQQLGYDVVAQHAANQPSFASGTPSDPTQYNYFQVQHLNGNKEILQVPAIRPNSVTISESRKMLIEIDGVDPILAQRLTEALSSNGAPNIKVSYQ